MTQTRNVSFNQLQIIELLKKSNHPATELVVCAANDTTGTINNFIGTYYESNYNRENAIRYYLKAFNQKNPQALSNLERLHPASADKHAVDEVVRLTAGMKF